MTCCSSGDKLLQQHTVTVQCNFDGIGSRNICGKEGLRYAQTMSRSPSNSMTSDTVNDKAVCLGHNDGVSAFSAFTSIVCICLTKMATNLLVLMNAILLEQSLFTHCQQQGLPIVQQWHDCEQDRPCGSVVIGFNSTLENIVHFLITWMAVKRRLVPRHLLL